MSSGSWLGLVQREKIFAGIRWRSRVGRRAEQIEGIEGLGEDLVDRALL